MIVTGATIERHTRADFVRWGFCVLVVVCMHGAVMVWLCDVPPRRMAAATPSPAVLLDLAPPEPVTPPEPPLPPVPVPEAATQQPVTPEMEPPPPPEPVAVPDVVRPVIPPPVVKPRALTPVHHEAPRTIVPAAPPVPVTPRVAAAPAPAPTAVSAGVASARWEDAVAAYIGRFRQYPLAAQRRGDEGVALVRFAVDRAGNVSSVALVRSSGHADLDHEATSWIGRAQPVPPPPPEIAQSRIELVIPLRFELH